MRELTQRFTLPDGTIIEFFASADLWGEMPDDDFMPRACREQTRRPKRKQKRQAAKIARRKNRG